MASIGGNYDTVISNIDDLEKAGVYTATSPLQVRANEVRANRVNWQSYLHPSQITKRGQMISKDDFDIITKLDNGTPEYRDETVKKHANQCAKTFLTLMDHIAKDQTVQYVLTMIDDMLQEDKTRVEIFREYSRKSKQSVWTPFLNMLNRPDGFIVNQTSRIIAKIACWSQELMEGSDLQYYLTWLKDQMKTPNQEYLQTVARCLQMMLRIDQYRYAFMKVDGIGALVSVLAGKVGFQIQYQLTFCLWVLTFNPDLSEKISKYNVIPIMADILSEVVKEKVIRIILATFRNLLAKPTERETLQDNALSMVQCKVLKHLALLEGRKFDDQDVVDDIEYLTEKLQASVQDLSSFDEYCSEIKSGRLEWSPVHKSEKFWRENSTRLNEKNYELLKILIKLLETSRDHLILPLFRPFLKFYVKQERILIKLLETSRDPLILSVAAHDVGEYVRHYPRGKHVIEQLGGKTLVMQYLVHEDPNVRYEALLAVQKLMVHNWEYLGKQLQAVNDNSSATAVES